MFQFLIGRLKTDREERKWKIKSKFQFLIGRLKTTKTLKEAKEICGFNSS